MAIYPDTGNVSTQRKCQSQSTDYDRKRDELWQIC
jgi:hypothetical protein